MKNFFVILASVVLIASCSSDAEQATTLNEISAVRVKQEKSLHDIETLYADMIASRSYNDYQDALNIFTNKMNFDGDPRNLNTDSNIKEWIRLNISKTNFTDYTSAANEYEALEAIRLIMHSNNVLFFETLQREGTENLLELITYPDPVSNSCPDVCKMSYRSCLDWVKAWYEAEVQVTTSTWVSPDIQSTNQYNNAMLANDIGQFMQVESCDNEFAECCAS